MAIEITVPRLGWSMDEGTFVGWLKKEGEHVEEGELLFELEGDKSQQEVESFDQGYLRLPADAPEPGDPVIVGQCLGFLCEANEPIPARCSMSDHAATEPGTAPDPSPNPKKLVTEKESDSEQPISPKTDKPRSPVSPRAAATAIALDIDLNDVAGSGRGGRIRERDVLKFAEGRATASAKSSTATRNTIAARMVAGANETAPVTLMSKADATNLLHLRTRLKKASLDSSTPPSLTSMLAFLVAKTLEQHLPIQSQWTRKGIKPMDQIHLAIGVDTDKGLMAPVIRDANTLTLLSLSERMREVIDRSRLGTSRPEELRGGTFTLTNLGEYPIDGFTPIINPPQSAILGIGRIQTVPTAEAGALVMREQMTLSLTFDHRVHDGVRASQFLASLVDLISTPTVLSNATMST